MTAQETTAYKAIEANYDAAERKLEELQAELTQRTSSDTNPAGNPRSQAAIAASLLSWQQAYSNAASKRKAGNMANALSKIKRDQNDLAAGDKRIKELQDKLIPNQLQYISQIENSMLAFIQSYNNGKSQGLSDGDANLIASQEANAASSGATLPQWLKNPFVIVGAIIVLGVITFFIIKKLKK